MERGSNSGSDFVEDHFRDALSDLRKPVTDLKSLARLLATPLALYDVLPDHLIKHSASQSRGNRLNISWLRYIPLLQEAILQHILHTWLAILTEENLLELLDYYFCPPFVAAIGNGSAAGYLALHAYSSLRPVAGDEYAIGILDRLGQAWAISGIHRTIYSGPITLPDSQTEGLWRDYLQSLFAIPGKLANASGQNEGIPRGLQYHEYFPRLLVAIEELLNGLCSDGQPNVDVYQGSLTDLFTKLVNTGMFPYSTPTAVPRVSYFALTNAITRRRLQSPSSGSQYSDLFISLIASLPALVAQKFLASLLSSIEWKSNIDTSLSTRRKIAREAVYLQQIVGPLDADQSERWSLVSGVVIGRSWPEELGRVLVRWTAGQRESPSEKALGVLMERTLDLWTSPQHIKYSLLPRHRYLTTILLLTASRLPAASSALRALSKSPLFLEAIATYIGHSDASVKRCGMLVAEVIAKKMGQKLDFGDWDEGGQGRDWCRALRGLLDEGGDVVTKEEEALKNVDSGVTATEEVVQVSLADSDDEDEEDSVNSKQTLNLPMPVDSDDDSLAGYGSKASSRSPSPTPSELDEIEKDPTLVSGRSGTKKVQRPVYLIQLGQLLVPASKSNEKDEADRIEMSLNEGALLIRRKAGFGLELEENAVDLVCGYVRLQDNYDLDGFNEKRQEALNALVVCCPQRAAPCLIEQFFTGQYSTDTRFAIMTALAMGARELSGFVSPPAKAINAFPSKFLPPALHRKYFAEEDLPEHGTESPILQIMEGLSRQIIDKTRGANEGKVPQLVREKQLRVRNNVNSITGRGISISEVGVRGGKTTTTSFNDIAAEFFIMPLINRFWIHLRDEQSREARSRTSKTSYKGAGTGMILGAMTLAQFLLTLAILLHAGRNSPAFLAVLAPESLELAVTMGTRPVSESESSTEDGEGGKKANVLAAALELALVVFDMSWELDAGRTLSFDHVRVLLAAKEWAESVFKALEKGALVDEGGGEGERRVRRASAGVLLTIEQIIDKWRGAMSGLI
ncbi:telomere binding protein [Tulasnella sp. JGI-2019a]|nr:telomere binding protein [Tulasnella sp. JGI-2019a]